MNKVMMMGLVDYGRNGIQMDTSKNNLLRFTLRVRKAKVAEGSNEVYDFVPVVAFGKTSELIAKYVQQGNALIVEGQWSSYKRDLTIIDQQGQQKQIKVDQTNVLVSNIQFIPREKGENNSGGGGNSYANNNNGGYQQQTQNTAPQSQQTYNIQDDELPF